MVKWLKEPELNNEEVKSRMSSKSRSSKSGKFHPSFSDASKDGCAQVSYLRLVNDQSVVNFVLLIGKARVSPLRYVSMSRLKLVAATLSVKIALLLREELDNEINKEHFWTDSKVVLGHISNSSKRFKIFIANRIHFIHDHSDVAQ